jgi:hypothetical protein
MYQLDDRWGTIADAYKYAVLHPDILRSVAFSRFGVMLTWELKTIDAAILRAQLLKDEQDNVTPPERAYVRLDDRPVHDAQLWRLDIGSTQDEPFDSSLMQIWLHYYTEQP